MNSFRVLEYVYDYAEPDLEQVFVCTQRALQASGSEIERVLVGFVRGDLVAEKDAEIERLRKALEQAVKCGDFHIVPGITGDYPESIGSSWSAILFDTCWNAELAAYLRERDNRPPDRVVQNVVQDAGEGGGTDV